jgi:hypothetical protein
MKRQTATAVTVTLARATGAAHLASNSSAFDLYAVARGRTDATACRAALSEIATDPSTIWCYGVLITGSESRAPVAESLACLSPRGVARAPACKARGSRAMKTYRCYFLNDMDHIASVELISCQYDDDATTMATKLLKGRRQRTAEVWDGDRKVIRIDLD